MANFFIQIDKPFYFAGDVVNGNILVNVMQPIAATGISLKFTGYECVKWNTSREIVRPPHVQGQPPPPDPIAAIPPHLIYNSDNFNVSDVEEADNTEYDHRPKYIRTSQGRVFQMHYFETRNVFTSIKTMVYSCNGLAPGQYSFPISFKTFEGWPASFEYSTPRKKGRIIYRLAANVEPTNPKFEMAHAIEITMRETRQISAATKRSSSAITSCCCIGKGTSAINVHFEKDGYMQNEDVRMIIEVDNSQCTVDITGIYISVTNTVGLRSAQSSTSDTYNVLSKNIAGLPAGTKMVGNEAIKEGFKLMANTEIKPTCSGKLLSSHFDLTVRTGYDVTCDCCGTTPSAGIRIIIFPSIRTYQLPTTFTSGWAPKLMPICNFVLPNTFENFNINAMAMQNNFPPPPPPPMPPVNMNANMNMANNMANQQMNLANNMANNMANQNMNMANNMMNANMNMANNMANQNMNMANNMANSMANSNMNRMNANMNAGMNMNVNANMGGANFNMNNNGMGMNMEMTEQPMMGGGFEMTDGRGF